MKKSIIAISLLAAATLAQAGKWTAPKQDPDNFSNAELHSMAGLIIGIAAARVMDESRPITQWAACQVPLAIHEFAPSPGNYRSNKDLLVNSLSCGFGVWAGNDFAVTRDANGTIMFHKIWRY